MNKKEVSLSLTGLGWAIYTDEVGDKVAHFTLPDRIVDIIYGIRIFRNDKQLEAMLSTSTQKYSEVCSEIRGE